jgi:hypothetical protein
MANAYRTGDDANNHRSPTHSSKRKSSIIRRRREFHKLRNSSFTRSSTNWTHLRNVGLPKQPEPPTTNEYNRCLFIPTIGVWTNRLNLALFQAIIIASIVMGTVGAIPKDHSDTGDHSPMNPGVSKTGWILLLICLVLLMAQGAYLLQFRVQQASSFAIACHLKTLLYCLFASLPFAMVRIAYEVAYIFDPTQARNTEVGDFMIILFVVFLMQLFAVLPVVLGGFLTRNIGNGELGLVSEESRRAFREDPVLKSNREEAEEQHNRRRDLAWLNDR